MLESGPDVTQQNPASKQKRIGLVRSALILTALLFIPGLIQFRQALDASGYLALSEKWRLGADSLYGLSVILVVLAALSFTRLAGFFLRFAQILESFFKRLRLLNVLLFLAIILLFPFLLILKFADLTGGFFTRLFVLWCLALAGFCCLSGLWPARRWPFRIIASLLAISAAFRVAFFFTSVNDFPLTLYWSETSNYYYSSLFLSQKIYGISMPLPLFNPGRALLGVVPFLFPDPQILVSRLWAAILWVICTSGAAWLVARRLRFIDRLSTILLAGWAFFFILQGPIYYELLISAMIVLAFFDAKRFGRSLLAVGAASLWAGLCRVNWYPVPGALAALLYILETPRVQSWPNYFLRPLAWMVSGTGIALVSFAAYGAISGNPTSTTATALQSPLIWSRLLPGATDPLGVLPDALLVAFPALILIGRLFSSRGRHWDALRLLGILAILLVFFAGGLVVSVKIGGGSNIHDLDAFWFILLVVACYLFFGRTMPDHPDQPVRVPPLLTGILVALPLLLPLTLALPSPLPDRAEVNHVINDVNAYVAQAVHAGKEVLFIDNRQLITYGFIRSAKMVPDYETGYFLEMAFINQQDYFDKWNHDLKANRFGVIVANPQPTELQDPSHSFAEENNAQIKWIGQPLLCYYQNLKTWMDVGISVLVPEPVPCK